MTTPTAETVLEAEGLTKHFPVRKRGREALTRAVRVVHAVDDVDLTLRRGQVVSLVGESGSGKSTVARLLAQLYPRTSGDIRLHGESTPHVVAHFGEARLEIAVGAREDRRFDDCLKVAGKIDGVFGGGEIRWRNDDDGLALAQFPGRGEQALLASEARQKPTGDSCSYDSRKHQEEHHKRAAPRLGFSVRFGDGVQHL